MTPNITWQVLDPDPASHCGAVPASEKMETATWLGDDLPADEQVGSERDVSLSELVTDIQADRLLVERCLAGEVAASGRALRPISCAAMRLDQVAAGLTLL